jgi:hypothetical protein
MSSQFTSSILHRGNDMIGTSGVGVAKHKIGLISFAVAACLWEGGCNQDDPGGWPYESRGTEYFGNSGSAGGGVGPPMGSGGETSPTTGANTDGGSTPGVTSAAGMGTAAIVGGGGAMSGGGMGGDGAGSGVGGSSPTDPCDLTGRWLVTTHYVTVALGANQTAHSYGYYEIGKKGSDYVVTKGLYCGDFAHGTGLVDVQVHFDASNATVFKRVNTTGRTATSTMSAGGCHVHFSKLYTVKGATVPYYVEAPSRTMPTAQQQASADGKTPGWEDWDGDGNPGITGTISSSVVNGKIFTAPRRWDEPQGTVPNVTSTFKLSLAGWGQDQDVMQSDPPDNIILLMTATVANDPSLHFVGFARLGANQATGDDRTICSQIMQLAPTLTPDAAAI